MLPMSEVRVPPQGLHRIPTHMSYVTHTHLMLPMSEVRVPQATEYPHSNVTYV